MTEIVNFPKTSERNRRLRNRRLIHDYANTVMSPMEYAKHRMSQVPQRQSPPWWGLFGVLTIMAIVGISNIMIFTTMIIDAHHPLNSVWPWLGLIVFVSGFLMNGIYHKVDKYYERKRSEI